MKNVKRLLFVHFGDDWIRGSETCLIDLLKYCLKSDIAVVVWTNNPSLVEQCEILKVTVEYDHFSVIFGWRSPKLDVRNWLKLISKGKKLVKSHGINSIHCNSIAPCQWMIPVSFLTKVTCVTHVHSKYPIREILISGVHFSDRIIGVSEDVSSSFNQNSESRCETIHNAISLKPCRLRDNDFGSAPKIYAIGSLIKRKGFDTLLHSFALIREEYPETTLTIIGDGPERKNLQTMSRKIEIEHCCNFSGALDNAKELIAEKADIVIVPSRDEAFGLVALEAQLSGAPVVASRVGGLKEVVVDEHTGLLFEANDVLGLRDQIIRLLQSNDLRKTLCANALDVAQKKFGFKRYGRQVIGVHNSCNFELLSRHSKFISGIKAQWHLIKHCLKILMKIQLPVLPQTKKL